MVYEDEQIRERISRLMSREGLSQLQFANKVGRRQPEVSDFMRGKKKLTRLYLSDILAAFPNLRKEWLIDGEGTIYKDEEDYHKQLPSNTRPRLPRTLTEGHLQEYFEGAKRCECEEVPVDTRMPDYDFTLYLKTDRMSPNYRRGDELFFKKTSIKEWGGCYLLDTDEGPKFKKVYEDTDEEGNPGYRCVAYDRVQYPDFFIPKQLVHGFYKCVGALRIL